MLLFLSLLKMYSLMASQFVIFVMALTLDCRNQLQDNALLTLNIYCRYGILVALEVPLIERKQ